MTTQVRSIADDVKSSCRQSLRVKLYQALRIARKMYTFLGLATVLCYSCGVLLVKVMSGEFNVMGR